MNQLATGRRQFALVTLFVLAIMSLAACSSVRLISDYDPIVDQSVTALQKDIDTFLTRMENPDPPEFGESNDFYTKTEVDLRAIQVRASARPKNQLIIDQLDLVGENLGILATIHEAGLEDPQEIELMRDAFQTQFRAILTLELAKRRGEK